MTSKKIIKKNIKKIPKKILMFWGQNNLPDFVIIGAQKAGTVALSRYLKQHPKIIGANIEIGFFSTNKFYNGINWYKNQLPIRINKKKLIFEKTPEYIYYPESPKRMKKILKNDIKFILIIRNPIDRAFSGWNHYQKYYYSWDKYTKESLISRLNNNLGFEKGKYMLEFLNNSEYKDFHNSIKDEISFINDGVFIYEPSFVRRGLYFEQIENYLKYFEKKQLFIIESSELRNNKQKVLNKLTDFLGISSFDFSKIDLKNIHKSEYKGKKIDEKSRRMLRDFYKPYNEKLFNLIGEKYDWD
jgi:hypothetical protein